MFFPCIWCFSYIQHGSYPVMSPDNSSFPLSVYTGRTSLHYITTKSAYQPHDATIFPVYNPLPGNWFVAAYISHWDQHVRQEVRFCFEPYRLNVDWKCIQNVPKMLLTNMSKTFRMKGSLACVVICYFSTVMYYTVAITH